MLALVALSDVSPELGDVLAPQTGLRDGSARTTARIVARLLAHAGYAEGSVYRALDAQGTLLRSGAVRMLAAPDDVPLVDRPLACATAVATFLLAADVDDPSRGGRLRRARSAARCRSAARRSSSACASCSRWPTGRSRSCTAPTPTCCSRRPRGGGVLLAAATELADPVLRLDAAIAAILEQRVLAIDGLDGARAARGRASSPAGSPTCRGRCCSARGRATSARSTRSR